MKTIIMSLSEDYQEGHKMKNMLFAFSHNEYYTYLEEILWRSETPKDKLKTPNVINPLNCTK